MEDLEGILGQADSNSRHGHLNIEQSEAVGKPAPVEHQLTNSRVVVCNQCQNAARFTSLFNRR
jgi:hypothetical protein